MTIASLLLGILESDSGAALSVVFFCLASVQRNLGGQEENAFFTLQVSLILVILHVFHALTYNPLAHWRIYPLILGFGLQFFYVTSDYSLLCVLPALVTGITLYLLPVSTPTLLIGKHTRIGTVSFNFSAADSDESYMKDIPVQCWFPMKEKGTTSSSNSKAMLWTSGNPQEQERELFALLNALARNQKLPSFALKHLALTRVNSIFNLDLTDLSDSKKVYPVAIYSHGLYGWRQIHHTACEKLASEGIIVFALDHQPDSTLSRPYKKLKTTKKFDFNVPAGSTPMEDHTFYAQGIERRQSQILALIQFLPSISNRLDLSLISCFGHSYGE